MFNAEYFSYDGKHSSQFGLRIASFDSDNVEEVSFLAPTINTNKATFGRSFAISGMTYESPPEMEISLVCDEPLTELGRREIMQWLKPSNTFKRLEIEQPDYDGIYFNCAFNNLSIVYVNGWCVGFKGTLIFDSQYCYGKGTSVTVAGDGTTQTVMIMNKSDIPDDYTYPTVVFTTATDGSVIDGVEYVIDEDGSGGANISIVNVTDSVSRAFEFCDLAATETVTVDNELKIITSDVPGNKLQYFTKKWLRLLKGKNTLNVTAPQGCTVTITCPRYELIGF